MPDHQLSITCGPPKSHTLIEVTNGRCQSSQRIEALSVCIKYRNLRALWKHPPSLNYGIYRKRPESQYISTI